MKTEAAVSREGAPAPVIEEVELESPRAGEVLVRIVASGICHTDVRSHSGAGMPVPKPIVLGHEGAGVVERVGDGVVELAPGDHVVLSGVSCGACPKCRANRPTYCRDAIRLSFGGARADGSSPLSRAGARIHGPFFGQSSFARHAVAPARSAVKVPRDMPLATLGPLGCGVITGAGAVIEAFKLKPGQSIVVFGAGGVGLSAVMAARMAGAGRIAVVDVNGGRLTLALELGADETFDADGGDPVAALREASPDGYDFAFNTTNIPGVYSQALASLALEGTMAFVTMPKGGWTPELATLFHGGRKLKGILGGDANPQSFIPMLIEQNRRGAFPFERLQTSYPFAKIADAFADVAAGRSIKPVLHMDEG
jgi:aryl-alcohol dehydrogenase